MCLVLAPDVNNAGNEWACKTCDRALKQGVMPLQAKANGLQLSQIPPEQSDLNGKANLSTCAFHYTSFTVSVYFLLHVHCVSVPCACVFSASTPKY